MTTIKFRRDTSANWTSVNPIPAQGEPCYETDTGKLKIGNGSDSYTTLPYVSDSGGAADLPIASSTTLGAIKVGDNLTITADGTLSASSSGDLPIATETTLGGIKVGNNLSITEDGTLSANGGSAGTTDYTQLENKPQINSVELSGNKTLNDLGIQPKGNYLTALPDNAVTTDTDQTIEGVKTFTQDVTVPSIRTTANGTIKLAHPMNNASGIITLNNNYGQLSISSSLEGNNNLLGVTRGTTYALINGDNITTKDKDGNLHYYINSQNIDTTYMKWDTNTGKLKVDTAAVAGLAMPYNKYINLTLGENNSKYTAPANGYFAIVAQLTENNGSVAMFANNIYNYASNPLSGAWLGTFIPIKKGAEMTIQYQNIKASIFVFTYAEGSK